jgi:hypothetical protein
VCVHLGVCVALDRCNPVVALYKPVFPNGGRSGMRDIGITTESGVFMAMEGVAVKSSRAKLTIVWVERVFATLLAGITFVSVASAQQIKAGEKGRVKGKIVARYGARVEVQATKTGSLAMVVITDGSSQQ